MSAYRPWEAESLLRMEEGSENGPAVCRRTFLAVEVGNLAEDLADSSVEVLVAVAANSPVVDMVAGSSQLLHLVKPFWLIDAVTKLDYRP